MPHCPDCSCTLLAVTKNEINIDVCPTCRGTWFDAGELNAYRKSHPEVPEVPREEIEKIKSFKNTSEVCPGCRSETFLRGELKNHKVGRCPSCSGVWVGDSVNDQAWKHNEALWWLNELAYWIFTWG